MKYILQQMSEDYGFKIEFHPKPVMGDWNGSGLHCNFSNDKIIQGLYINNVNNILYFIVDDMIDLTFNNFLYHQ